MQQSPIDTSYRRRLRQAVFPDAESSAPDPIRPAVVAGLILEARPHELVLATHDGNEVRQPISEQTVVWYAGKADHAALQPARRAIVRLTPDGSVAERIWLDIVRANGIIVARDRTTVEIDEGPHRGRTHVVIPARALSHILVRHPYLEPGYLFDVIGVRSEGGLVAVRPGAPQPAYPADQVPKPRPAWPVSHVLAGTATWFGGLGACRQAAYPALDPSSGGCAAAHGGCASLPYLSLGSELLVRNECTGRSATVPVTECGCVAARFCDRCVQCGTSPRGRIVELSPASFVDLGGDLDEGCFNVTVRVG
ncbi:MAG TPA: hypothetical protein VFU43_10020 [Streptosporangiaceae bacterium]|nr:hypothetical protein [Streptosporangiaceae bacterium]